MEDNKKELNRLTTLIHKAVEYRKNTRDKEYINNEAHFEGLHWELANLDNESPFIVKSDINHLKNAVLIRLSSLYANTYYGILKPLSPNDVKRVETLNVVYQNEWKRLKADDIIEDVIRSGAIFDNGYVEINYNPNHITGGTNAKRKGVITLKQIDTAKIYLDPTASSINDCDFIVKRDTVTKEWLEREYPEWLKIMKSKQEEGGFSKDNSNGNIFVGRDYNTNQSLTYKFDTVYEKVVKKIEIPIEGTEIVDEMGNIIQESKTEKVDVVRVKFSYILENILVEQNEDYPFDFYPIIAFQWEKQPQSPYGIPLLRGLTVPQKMANLIESAANNIAMHYTIPTWLISDESGLDVDEVAELINAIGVVWKVTNIEGAIKQLEPPSLDSDIITIGNSYVAYLREYAGATQAYQGEIGTAGSTAEGTNAAINRATIIDNDPMKQIKEFVEALTRALICFMTRYYEGDTIYIRTEKGNQEFSFQEFLIDSGFEDIQYDFDVDLGSRSKTDKNRQYNLLKDLYQLQNQYKDKNPVINIPDLVKAAQLDNYNEMYTRLENITEEAYAEKASLILELVQMGNTTIPNGDYLIPAELLQNAIIDVLNDDNSLETAQQVISMYEEYQTAISQFNNQQTLSNQQALMQQMSNTQNTETK